MQTLGTDVLILLPIFVAIVTAPIKITFMKPTRNKYYCADCGRTKMLFETEKQADNFILFNAAEFDEEGGHVPVRSYYCSMCMGWHVTSNNNSEHFAKFKSRAELLVEQYNGFWRFRSLQKANQYINQREFAKAAIKLLNYYNQLKSKGSITLDVQNSLFESILDISCALAKTILQNKSKKDYESFRKLMKRLRRTIGEDEKYTDYMQTLNKVLDETRYTVAPDFEARDRKFLEKSEYFERKGDYFNAAVTCLLGFNYRKSNKSANSEEATNFILKAVKYSKIYLNNNWPLDGKNANNAHRLVKRIKKAAETSNVDIIEVYELESKFSFVK